jgi:hypothetical protein
MVFFDEILRISSDFLRFFWFDFRCFGLVTDWNHSAFLTRTALQIWVRFVKNTFFTFLARQRGSLARSKVRGVRCASTKQLGRPPADRPDDSIIAKNAKLVIEMQKKTGILRAPNIHLAQRSRQTRSTRFARSGRAARE